MIEFLKNTLGDEEFLWWVYYYIDTKEERKEKRENPKQRNNRKQASICVIREPEREENWGAEKIFEEILAKKSIEPLSAYTLREQIKPHLPRPILFKMWGEK